MCVSEREKERERREREERERDIEERCKREGEKGEIV